MEHIDLPEPARTLLRRVQAANDELPPARRGALDERPYPETPPKPAAWSMSR